MMAFNRNFGGSSSGNGGNHNNGGGCGCLTAIILANRMGTVPESCTENGEKCRNTENKNTGRFRLPPEKPSSSKMTACCAAASP